MRLMLKLWKSFKISFLGRITAIKMTILPKILYLFRALPIRLNKVTITKFQTEINKFIWSDSRPRLSRSVLHNPQKNGGLGLPDFWLYYLAARWSQIAQWHILNPKIPWVRIEKDYILPYSISGILWGNKIPNHTLDTLNQLVSQSYQLWKLHNKKYNLISNTPPHASFVGDPKFLLNTHEAGDFTWWINNNLISFFNFLENNNFNSFSSLKSQHQIPNTEFNKFLQIRHFLAHISKQ